MSQAGNSDSVPTGAEIYAWMTRRAAKKSSANAKKRRENPPVPTQNRFDGIAPANEPESSNSSQQSQEKPVPLYIRGKNPLQDVYNIMKALKITNYEVKRLKGGLESKLQLTTIADFNNTQKKLQERSMAYYTHQLKSERALKVILKGLDPETGEEAICNRLKELGFDMRRVTNCRNRFGKKSQAFMLELNIGNVRASSHPIYELKSLNHVIVSVEAPRKNKNPVQCHNCQEFGHSRNRCHLKPVCVICAETHKTADCNKNKDDQNAKKCNNCGKAHTANYKGCTVYLQYLERMNPKQRRKAQSPGKREDGAVISNPSATDFPPLQLGMQSYSNITATTTPQAQSQGPPKSNDHMQLLILMQTNMFAMQNSLSEMMKKQNALEEGLNSLNQSISHLLARN